MAGKETIKNDNLVDNRNPEHKKGTQNFLINKLRILKEEGELSSF